jgi:acyl-CoA thioesterase FadM
MFPVARLAQEVLKLRKAPALSVTEGQISTHICWPIDIDIFGELNNGRTLTLYDLGRFTMGMRVGMIKALKKNGWAMTMAGVSVRYRRRVKMFQKFTVHTRTLGRDDRFLYLHQSMWRNGEATSSALYRAAITDKNGIVPTDQLAEALGYPDWNPELPEWVQNWIAAEGTRTWPPIA